MRTKEIIIRSAAYLSLVAMLLLLCFPSVNAFDWNNNLLNYYKFNETAGTKFVGIGGLGENLTNQGATMGVTGKLGTAVNTSTGYANKTSSLPYGNFTISVWFKLNKDTGAFQKVYAIGKDSDWKPLVEVGVAFISGKKNIQFNVGGSTGLTQITGTTNLSLGVWYHTVATFNDTKMALYLNGTSIGTATYGGDSWVQSGMFEAIGASPYALGSRVNGTIDDLGIWTRAINSSEVLELWNSSNGMPYSTDAYVPPANDTSANCTVIMNYTTGYSHMINFTFYDETNQSKLYEDVDYIFYYGRSNITLNILNNTLSNTSSLYFLCNGSNYYLGSGEIQYGRDSYSDRRFYTFTNTSVSNQSIRLYSIASNLQTSFKLQIEDTSLTPYVDVFAQLLRWYPAFNEYRIVDMGKTDEQGATVVHVVTEDVDYRIGVYYQNGTLIKLTDPTRMVCLTSPCTYTIQIAPSDLDYSSIYGVTYTFSFNETSNIWTISYSDPSLLTTKMNLTIYKDTGISSTPICASSSTATTGILTCNTSLYTGTLKGIVLRDTIKGSTSFVQKIVNVVTSVFKSSWGLWLSLLIVIPIIFLFVLAGPNGAIMGGVIALIPALYLGSVNLTIIGGLALLGGIIIHFVNRLQ
jgi:hypothetical protein